MKNTISDWAADSNTNVVKIYDGDAIHGNPLYFAEAGRPVPLDP